MKKVIPAIVLSCALLLSSGPVLRADELDDAIRDQQKLTEQANQVQGRLNQLTYTADKMKKDQDQLKAQISAATASLNQKQSAYNQAQAEVAASEKELQAKVEQLDQRRLALAQRVRGIYENGQISYLGILFESSSISDFITRIEYLSRLVDNDQQLLSDIRTEKDHITKKTEELKAARDQAAVLQAQAAAAKKDLDSKNGQLQVSLAANKKVQDELSDQIEQLEKDSNAIGEKIRQIQRSRKGGVVGSVSNWPLPGRYEISSPFGYRVHPITKQRKLHTGVDLPAPTGTAIQAAGDGEVIYAGWYGAYGNAVVIDHGEGTSTLYGHQSRIAVSNGDAVKAGQVIGYVGSTGWSTGPHLHFEVRVGGNPTDPLRYFN